MIVIESINHVGITVSNIDKAAAFYKDLFDFEVIDKFAAQGQAVMKMGDIVITLYEVDGYTADKNSKSCVAFYLDEQDFDDAIDELEETGIKILFGPENIRKGKTVVFADPDGNRIELSYPRID
jgi:predicted enzyme related to lactoylglutathione lyase